MTQRHVFVSVFILGLAIFVLVAWFVAPSGMTSTSATPRSLTRFRVTGEVFGTITSLTYDDSTESLAFSWVEESGGWQLGPEAKAKSRVANILWGPVEELKNFQKVEVDRTNDVLPRQTYLYLAPSVHFSVGARFLAILTRGRILLLNCSTRHFETITEQGAIALGMNWLSPDTLAYISGPEDRQIYAVDTKARADRPQLLIDGLGPAPPIGSGISEGFAWADSGRYLVVAASDLQGFDVIDLELRAPHAFSTCHVGTIEAAFTSNETRLLVVGYEGHRKTGLGNELVYAAVIDTATWETADILPLLQPLSTLSQAKRIGFANWSAQAMSVASGWTGSGSYIIVTSPVSGLSLVNAKNGDRIAVSARLLEMCKSRYWPWCKTEPGDFLHPQAVRGSDRITFRVGLVLYMFDPASKMLTRLGVFSSTPYAFKVPDNTHCYWIDWRGELHSLSMKAEPITTLP